MNYERFYIPGDTQGQASFPQYDVEDTFTSDNPISFQLGLDSLKTVRRTGLRHGISLTDEEIVSNSIRSMRWVTDSAAEGLRNLVIISPTSDVALRLSSRITDAPNTKKVTSSWVERQIDRYKRKQQGEFKNFNCSQYAAGVLFGIEDATGVESFQLITAQGALLYSNFINNSHKGNVVATMNTNYDEVAFLPESIVQGPYDQSEMISIVSSLGRPVEAVSLDNFV